MSDGYMNYKIEIKETLSRIIDIEAENESEAIKDVRKQYINEKIILNAEDYVETEFTIHK